MNAKPRVMGLIERKLEKPEYRQHFDDEHNMFKLEVQLLLALERHGLTHAQLARMLHISQRRITRTLCQGGISSAKLSQIQRMGDVLGLAFVPVMLPKAKLQAFLPKLERLVAA